MTWLTDRLAWLAAPWSAVSDLQRDVMRLQMQLREMRSHLMARMDDMARRLDAATNEIAGDLQQLKDRVATLDEGLAAQFEPLVARLEAMGQDVQNPVPDAPVPGDGGGAGQPADGTDVVNPTPGAEDNPNA